ncbi:MAG: hypothetical protein RJB66_842 [Pseudomonadota bacterium]|jgi:putative nucleotidyltransferase with HDIG domain
MCYYTGVIKRQNPNFNSEPPHIRYKYEVYTHPIVDWVNRIGLEKNWWGRLLLKAEAAFNIRRLFVLMLFSFVLAWVVSFELPVPISYQVGEIASTTLNSPMSFQMIDEVSTEEQRREAAERVLPIFDFDIEAYDKVSSRLLHTFRQLRTELRNKKLNQKLPLEWVQQKINSQLGIDCPEYLVSWLVRSEFNTNIETTILNILDQWFSEKIISKAENEKITRFTTVSMRSRQRPERELIIDRNEFMVLGDHDLFRLKDFPGLDRLSPEERDNLYSFTHLMLVPNVSLNEQDGAIRRTTAQDMVPPVIINIKKNQPIITEGSRITPRDLAIVHQIQGLQKENSPSLKSFFVSLILVTLMLAARSFFKHYSSQRFKITGKDFFVMSLIMLGEVVFTKSFLFVTEGSILTRFSSLLPSDVFLALAPLASGPMLVALLLTSGEVVFFFSLFLGAIVGMMVGHSYFWILFVWISGLAASRGVLSCKTRNDIYLGGIRCGIVSAVVLGCWQIVQNYQAVNFVRDLMILIGAGFFSGILSAMMAMVFVPILESLFNYTTDVKLLELSNLNHPLLKEMLVKSPGTYHHSMMVGSMVEAAAEEIGANPLLGKVICYYHDIGKLVHANYFIENQKVGQNPHDHISPYMSKTLLIAHVKDGVEMGMKYKLGQPIIDGILQHHGTTLINFFYNKALDMAEEGQEVAEEDFRYPGPKPQFREAALCMLADSIEAAARSLDEPTPARLQNIVRNIIQKKFLDGQLDECNLTLKDLTKVENAFVRILFGIYHQRIDYPKESIAHQTLGLTGKPLKQNERSKV